MGQTSTSAHFANDLGEGRNKERVRALVIVVALAALVPARARAGELELAIDGSCPRGDVPTEIASAVGRSLEDGPTRLRARIAMRSDRGRVRVVVGLDHGGARSERTFTASSCAAATHAAVLVVALALDRAEVPVAIAAPSVVEAPAASLELSFETELLDPVEEIVSEPEPREPVRASFLASALIDSGSLPGLEAGARLGAGVSIAPLLIELEATYLSASRAASVQPGASVDLVLAFGTLRAGARAALLSWLSIGGALELDVGAMSGTGAGVRLDAPSSAVLPWLAVRGALIVEVAITSVLALRASGSIGTPLVAPTFSVDGAGTVFSPSIVLGQGALGLVVRLS